MVIVRSSQPPVRSTVQPLNFCELLTKRLNEVGNSKQLLFRQDGTRPQQKQPLLPPEPRPTHLPIPQPPPPPPSSPTPSSDQSRDDRCLSLSIITVSSGYGSLTRSMEGQYFMHYDEDDNKDDIDIDCDLTLSTSEN